MTSIPDCLSAFSVAAMTNTPEAESLTEEAIDAYLASVGSDPRRRLAALHHSMPPTSISRSGSSAALAVKADIENRIVAAAAGPTRS